MTVSGDQTFEERAAAFAVRPDAVLMNSGPDVHDWVRPYTASFVVQGAPGAPPKLLGSGVFVALGARRFILTAGHCVKESGHEAVVITYSQFPRTTAYDLRRGADVSEGLDAGYFELSIPEWRTLESEGKVFMNHGRLLVDRGDAFVDDDHYVLAGFPSALGETPHPGAYLRKFHFVATSVAGRRNSAPSLFPRAAGVESLDLAVDGRHMTADLLSAEPREVQLPDLRGASGGPCWKGGVPQNDPATWRAQDMRVIGTHVARTVSYDDTERWMFARTILIGHHLRLIARDYPDMSDFIFSTWPVLATWSR